MEALVFSLQEKGAEVKWGSKTTDNDRLLKDDGRQVSSLIIVRWQHREKLRKLPSLSQTSVEPLWSGNLFGIYQIKLTWVSHFDATSMFFFQCLICFIYRSLQSIFYAWSIIEIYLELIKVTLMRVESWEKQRLILFHRTHCSSHSWSNCLVSQKFTKQKFTEQKIAEKVHRTKIHRKSSQKSPQTSSMNKSSQKKFAEQFFFYYYSQKSSQKKFTKMFIEKVHKKGHQKFHRKVLQNNWFFIIIHRKVSRKGSQKMFTEKVHK